MICHPYKCVFVHIPKTAGQSIEHVFLNLLGLNWDTRAPLLLRPNARPELGPPRLAHLKADEYVRYGYLSRELFSDYYKFSFVRNPWDRLVSMYKFMGYDKELDFRTFVLFAFRTYLFERHKWFVGPQSDFVYSKNGELLVDYIGRFEDLQRDFDGVCQKIGIPPTTLPHVNKSGGKPSVEGLAYAQKAIYPSENTNSSKCQQYQRYQDYYDDETIECVAQLYRDDIVLFGYDYD